MSICFHKSIKNKKEYLWEFSEIESLQIGMDSPAPYFAKNGIEASYNIEKVRGGSYFLFSVNAEITQ